MIAVARKPRRPGLVAVMLITVIFVLILLGGGLLRVAWMRHSGLKAAERRLQAEWLAESALDRASARLATSPDYAGETWAVAASEIGGLDDASVTIEVKPVSGQATRRAVHVRADYPRDAVRRARHSRELTIEITPRETPKSTPERKGDAPK
jgi:autonomous glycyl radical cofactor GrcA